MSRVTAHTALPEKREINETKTVSGDLTARSRLVDYGRTDSHVLPIVSVQSFHHSFRVVPEFPNSSELRTNVTFNKVLLEPSRPYWRILADGQSYQKNRQADSYHQVIQSRIYFGSRSLELSTLRSRWAQVRGAAVRRQREDLIRDCIFTVSVHNPVFDQLSSLDESTRNLVTISGGPIVNLSFSINKFVESLTRDIFLPYILSILEPVPLEDSTAMSCITAHTTQPFEGENNITFSVPCQLLTGGGLTYNAGADRNSFSICPIESFHVSFGIVVQLSCSIERACGVALYKVLLELHGPQGRTLRNGNSTEQSHQENKFHDI